MSRLIEFDKQTKKWILAAVVAEQSRALLHGTGGPRFECHLFYFFFFCHKKIADRENVRKAVDRENIRKAVDCENVRKATGLLLLLLPRFFMKRESVRKKEKRGR